MKDDSFVVTKQIKYEEACDFFRLYLREVNVVTVLYYTCIVLSFLCVAILVIVDFSFEGVMTNIGYVVIFAIPYAALHEGLHLIAYRLMGGVGLRIKIKKGMINSSCKEKLFRNSRYIIAALLPVVVITVGSIIVYVIFDEARECIIMMSMVQLLASKWDVALASYCYKYKEQYYYDISDEEVMYFLTLES